MTKEEAIINKLSEAFLPNNVECDGGCCMGCWKDVVREAIKMLEHKPTVISNEEIVEYAESITLDEWEQNIIINAAIWMRGQLTNK